MQEAKERFVLIDKNYKIKKNKNAHQVHGSIQEERAHKNKDKKEKTEQLTRTQGVPEITETFNQRNHRASLV